MLRYTLEHCQQFGDIERIENLKLTSKGLVGSVRYVKDSHEKTNFHKFLSDENALLWNGTMLEIRNVLFRNIREFIEEGLLPVQHLEFNLATRNLYFYLKSYAKASYSVGDSCILKIGGSFVLVTGIKYYQFKPQTYSKDLIKNIILQIVFSCETTVVSGPAIIYQGVTYYSRKSLYNDISLIQQAIQELLKK